MLEISLLIATPLLSFAGAWGGIKMQLKALHDRIEKHDKDDANNFRDLRIEIQEQSRRVDRILFSKQTGSVKISP